MRDDGGNMQSRTSATAGESDLETAGIVTKIGRCRALRW